MFLDLINGLDKIRSGDGSIIGRFGRSGVNLMVLRYLDESSRSLGLVVVLLLHGVFVVAEEPDRRPAAELIWDLFGNGERGYYEVFELGEAGPGEKLAARLTLRNQSDVTVGLESTKVACSCTIAKVPKALVARGDSVVLEFEFEMANRLRRDFETFLVDIVTDKKAPHRLIFKTKVVNAAAFLQNQIFVPIPKATSKTFDIPIFVSADLPIDLLRIEPTKDFEGVDLDVKIEREKDSASAKCRITDRFGKLSDGTDGRLQLVMKNGSVLDSTRLTVRNRPPIEVLPNRLLFLPDASEKQLYKSNAIVKINGLSERVDPELACHFTDGPSPKQSFVSMGKGVYRATIWVDRLKVETSFGTEAKLTWKAESMIIDGELSTPIHFSN